MKEYATALREKSGPLFDEGYLQSVIYMHPGIAETYFYELRKVVEF